MFRLFLFLNVSLQLSHIYTLLNWNTPANNNTLNGKQTIPIQYFEKHEGTQHNIHIHAAMNVCVLWKKLQLVNLKIPLSVVCTDRCVHGKVPNLATLRDALLKLVNAATYGATAPGGARKNRVKLLG